MKRSIIEIDESKCTGCGLCIPNCAEGSLEIRNGKAVLVKEALCDGLGACLGHCPEGALTVVERESEPFDEELVEERLAELGRSPGTHPEAHPQPAPSAGPLSFRAGGGCPSAGILDRTDRPSSPSATERDGEMPSQLSHWPVQLALLPPAAPFFRGKELVLSADCAPFAYADFHRHFLNGRAVAVACPKLDNAGAHFRKLIEIFREGGLSGVTVIRMEVPCCGGLTAMAAEAMKESGADLPVREVVIGRDGTIIDEMAPLAMTVG